MTEERLEGGLFPDKDDRPELPSPFIQTFRETLHQGYFDLNRFGFTETDNGHFQTRVSNFISSELGKLPNSDSLLQTPSMSGIEEQLKWKRLGFIDVQSIRLRTKYIILLSPLLSHEAFRQKKLNTQLKSMLVMLAREPVNAYVMYYPQFLEPLLEDDFLRLERKTLAVNVIKKLNVHGNFEYPEIGQSAADLVLATSLRLVEDALIKTDYAQDGYAKQAAMHFESVNAVFDYRSNTGDPAKDAFLFLKVLKAPVSLNFLLDLMGVNVKDLTPAIKEAFELTVSPYETAPGSGLYSL